MKHTLWDRKSEGGFPGTQFPYLRFMSVTLIAQEMGFCCMRFRLNSTFEKKYEHADTLLIRFECRNQGIEKETEEYY